jgi:hypothetical protein
MHKAAHLAISFSMPDSPAIEVLALLLRCVSCGVALMLSGLTFFRKDMYDLQPRWDSIRRQARKQKDTARRAKERTGREI